MRTAAESSLGAGNHQGVPGLRCTLESRRSGCSASSQTQRLSWSGEPRHQNSHSFFAVCAHTGDTSLRPTLRPTEQSVEGRKSLPEEGGGEARPERKSHPPPAFPESRPLEETPTSFPSMFLCP